MSQNDPVMQVGFTELFGSAIGDATGITQWLLNMFVTLVYLLLITKYSPAAEPRYNFGNMMMHILIVYFYIISLLLNPRVNLQDSAVDNVKWIDTSLVLTQSALLIFLVLVSFQKLAQLWRQAKEQVRAERAAEQLVEEHVEHFEQLRLHFSDKVAIALTNAHHYGGFGAVVGDVAEKRLLQPSASGRKGKEKGKRAKQHPTTVVSNPLSQLSDEEGSSSSGGDD